MFTEKFKASGYRLVLLFVLLSGCGGSGGDTATGTGSPSDTVNGYHVVKAMGFNEFNELVRTIEYDVDFENRTTEVTYTDYDLFDGTSSVSISTNYFNERGQMLRWRSADGGNTLYEYNEQGLLSQIVESNSTYGDSVFAYDSSGKLTTRTRTYSDNGAVTRLDNYSYLYNSAGQISNLSREKIFFQEGPLDTYTEIENTSFEHDAQGRIVRRESIMELSDRSDIAVEDYEYDMNGNMVKTTYSYNGLFLDSRTYEYAVSEQPLYNRWLRIFKYFP